MVAALLFARLGCVVQDATGENTGEERRSWVGRCWSCGGCLVNVLPLRAIKIVVTVWQIISQVCRHWPPYLETLCLFQLVGRRKSIGVSCVISCCPPLVSFSGILAMVFPVFLVVSASVCRVFQPAAVQKVSGLFSPWNWQGWQVENTKAVVGSFFDKIIREMMCLNMPMKTQQGVEMYGFTRNLRNKRRFRLILNVIFHTERTSIGVQSDEVDVASSSARRNDNHFCDFKLVEEGYPRYSVFSAMQTQL